MNAHLQATAGRTDRRPGRTRTLTWMAPCVAILLATAPLGAQEHAQSPWQCLPDEQTIFAMRIANGRAFADAMRKRTKLGAVMFSDERIDEFMSTLREQDEEKWQEMHDGLAEYGLAIEDFPNMLAGESGFALLHDELEDGSWLMIGLAWLEPGDELATRAHSALVRVIEEAADDAGEGEAPQRTDIELEGLTVMRLLVPNTETQYEYQEFEFPDNYDQMTEEEQEAFFDQMGQTGDPETHQVTRYSRHLIAHMGGRLLYAGAFNQSDESDVPEYDDKLAGAMSRFIAAQQDGGDGGFAARIADTDGVADALGQGGVAGFELYADLRPLVELVQQKLDEAADEIPFRDLIGFLGIGQSGVVAARAALEGNVMHQGFFIEAPAPRTGLMALLDQPEAPPIVPAWVPADAVAFQHVSFDLGKAYSHIKQLVIEQMGPIAMQNFDMAEQRVLATTQTELPALLSSLGDRHNIVTYEPQFDEPAQDDPPQTFFAPQMLFSTGDRGALVWQVEDEMVWGNLIQMAGGLLAMNNMGQFTQEQGFTGVRISAEGSFEGGLMLGRGHLVAAYGKGSLERTLSSLANPPPPDDSLRQGEVMNRASQLIELEPGTMFQVVDGDRYAAALRKIFIDAFERGMNMGAANAANQLGGQADEQFGQQWQMIEGQQQRIMEMLTSLIPDEEEIEGMLGPAAGYAKVTDRGLMMRSASLLPPP